MRSLKNLYTLKGETEEDDFFDASRLCISRQSIWNKLPHVAQIHEPWNELRQKLADDKIRIMLKTVFFSYSNIEFVSVSWWIFQSGLNLTQMKMINTVMTLCNPSVSTN